MKHLALVGSLLFAAFSVRADLYVDMGTSESGDGTAENPYNSLTNAFAKATTNETVHARGTYVVTDDAAMPVIRRAGLKLVPWGTDRLTLTAGATYNGPVLALSAKATEVTVEGCVFQDCCAAVGTLPGASLTGFTFISNRVQVATRACGSGRVPGVFVTTNGLSAVEMAYNVFQFTGSVTAEDPKPIFCCACADGFTGALAFHHNTVDGFGSLVLVRDGAVRDGAGAEQLDLACLDNILLCSAIISETSPTVVRKGSTFYNNAYLAGTTGLSENLEQKDNEVLSERPDFITTTWTGNGEGFYQLRAVTSTWVTRAFSASAPELTALPQFLGAAEPDKGGFAVRLR